MTSREVEPRLRRDGPAADYDAEQDVDLGRYWTALALRWWVPVALAVLGGVIGLLASLGGTRPYEARGIVYIGTPYGPGGASQLQNLPTRLASFSQFIHSPQVTRAVAAQSGIKVQDLRLGLHTKFVPGIVQDPKSNGIFSPLVTVLLDYRAAAPANAAVNAVMARVVRAFSTYVDLKLETYDARRARAERVLAQVNRQIDDALQRQEQLRGNPAGVDAAAQLILLANISNTLQYNESRQANLEGTLLTLRELIAQATQVERARIVQPATAERLPGPSRRTGALAGVVIGFIVGIFAALLWEPVARRVRPRAA